MNESLKKHSTTQVQDAKTKILKTIHESLDPDQNRTRKDVLDLDTDRTFHIFSHARHPNRWSGRHKTGPLFTPWTAWGICDSSCKKRRERYCKVKRKCGYTKHIEEQLCSKKKCHKRHTDIFRPNLQLETQEKSKTTFRDITLHSNEEKTNLHHHNRITTKQKPHYWLPVYEEIDENKKSRSPLGSGTNSNFDDEADFFIIKRRKPDKRKKRKNRNKKFHNQDNYGSSEENNNDNSDESNEDDDKDQHDFDVDSIYNRKIIKSIRKEQWRRSDDHFWPRNSKKSYNTKNKNETKNLKNPPLSNTNTEYDEQEVPTSFEYDDIDFDNEYDQSLNMTRVPQEKAVYEPPPKHKRAYSKWSEWSKCSTKCTTRRYKKCRIRDICGREVLREIAYCYTEGSFCQQWLQAQGQRTSPYDLRPMASSRKDVASQNSVFNDYIISGKGYRGPEYQPMKLKCGLAPIKNNRRNMYNMLKIIGGKASRKGEWPWQVVIFNRFKEAFCGGTLIAPQWVITAAHCVRKVLHVRIGEHNLDFNDGTEIEYRVVRSFKHPNYDKKTVDSDIALLRLPRPVNSTTYISYSCLPKPYQRLPKNIQCTVIGWGKRRNRDQAGTSVLHQADVPIIPMENCKNVYKDYTITNNMFCAGHKRGRIDTCAGDSGGPLLCRDGTKPNHPWTIFGITSFGDGCAKRNKFGIYTKVPNYVDWIWSVVNCNGNCKPNALNYR
ncbi:uncharacterized protein LOC129605984 [Condylostylus longicornis]|uniref:uncharacterized protein LOC129605984 n=1 Tax=Condylostylus longicornis TaxID=2530218 RepID=UPI00244E25BE|nr:uncharacterized protein LOC129605984 [Condylostylus longicornis]